MGLLVRIQDRTIVCAGVGRSFAAWQVAPGAWSPATDVYETGDSCVALVDLAGVREEDVVITYAAGWLEIKGERVDKCVRRAYHQMEIHYGRFCSRVAIPASVDADKAVARLEDGLLTVTLPKRISGFPELGG